MSFGTSVPDPDSIASVDPDSESEPGSGFGSRKSKNDPHKEKM